MRRKKRAGPESDSTRIHIPSSPETSYWDDSTELQSILRGKLSVEDHAWALPQLEAMGEASAVIVEPLAMIADRESPRLDRYDERGERVDRVVYHPAYREMESIAYGSGMIAMKYEEEITSERTSAVQLTGFALGYLFAMAEMSLYCPVCMTDGVARVLHLTDSDEFTDVISHLASRDTARLWTGGMFLTEKAGGSDVGANETTAEKRSDGWALTGEKWFCSNVDAEAVLVTARPEGGEKGTRGLRTYLVLPREASGVTIERLKPKLGVRSMPTGEVTFRETPAVEVGDFTTMTEMLNLSRLYNSVASVAVMGRAAREARHYIEHRTSFGRPIIEHPLAHKTLLDIEAEHTAALHLTFELVEMIGREDDGDEEAAEIRRFLTPMVKAVTGKLAVPVVSECMELLGGNGYIEEFHLPRLLRDAQVLPIWEGTTNILALDTVRAARKGNGAMILLEKIERDLPEEATFLREELSDLQQLGARPWMDRFARALEVALLNDAGRHGVAERIIARPLGLIPGASV